MHALEHYFKLTAAATVNLYVFITQTPVPK